jgi:uncharacterized membrane protein YqhA
MDKLDGIRLKIDITASIVAISSIHLLRVFMDLQDLRNTKLFGYVVFHLTFVVSALLMSYLEMINDLNGPRFLGPFSLLSGAIGMSARARQLAALDN